MLEKEVATLTQTFDLNYLLQIWPSHFILCNLSLQVKNMSDSKNIHTFYQRLSLKFSQFIYKAQVFF